jgi:hypothetical protein
MTLTSEQVDAITHAWLDLCASQEVFEGFSHERFVDAELSVACRDSVKELEDAFPFLLEGVDDE